MMREGRGRTSHPSVRGRRPRVIRELVCASDSCPCKEGERDDIHRWSWS